VGSLIFDKDNKVILLERGAKSRDSAGKLEGIGGGVDEGETDLHNVLKREIQEEVGNIQVSIDQTLTVRNLEFLKQVHQNGLLLRQGVTSVSAPLHQPLSLL
jgi:8-oxo-dGTP pyrophosphatase MutT (NUDIX family)